MEVFRSDSDCEVFLAMLGDASTRHRLEIHTYALMKNHVHLLVTPRTTQAIEKTMQVVGGRYARHFNDRYARTGALFEGRYRSMVIDTERYWFACMRYVEMNPVRAGLVSRPEAYYWTSYAANGLGAPDALLTPHPLYLGLATVPAERQRCWRAICATACPDEELARVRSAVHSGGSLGAIVLPETLTEGSEI
jgi:putative transposase